MKLDRKAIGRRLREARERAGFKDCAALAGKIFQDSTKKGRHPIDPETVRLWETGKVIPPWDKIDQLCELIKLPEEELLFGTKRIMQMRDERPRLIYTSPAEADLIVIFRHASPAAQKRIISMAKSLADDEPANTADFHILKPRS